GKREQGHTGDADDQGSTSENGSGPEVARRETRPADPQQEVSEGDRPHQKEAGEESLPSHYRSPVVFRNRQEEVWDVEGDYQQRRYPGVPLGRRISAFNRHEHELLYALTCSSRAQARSNQGIRARRAL